MLGIGRHVGDCAVRRGGGASEWSESSVDANRHVDLIYRAQLLLVRSAIGELQKEIQKYLIVL
jgi:hypothetical protein